MSKIPEFKAPRYRDFKLIYTFGMTYSGIDARFRKGLPPNTSYDVELAASSDSTNAGDARFDINGSFFDGSVDGAFDSLTDGYNAGNWMIWSSVDSGALGQLVLKADPDHFDNLVGAVRLNAMSISVVPEPSSAALLLGLGCMSLLMRRRRV